MYGSLPPGAPERHAFYLISAQYLKGQAVDSPNNWCISAYVSLLTSSYHSFILTAWYGKCHAYAK